MVHGLNNRTTRLIIWSLCIFSFVFLNGCSTTKRQDGPPPFHIDESCIPDAKPKKEALAKYGNMPKYRVFGKNYYVMKTAKNYHERGIASWYGMMFHKQRTSSGERYNLAAMTAAHKSLPLPTYVQVTNLQNNRKVIVKVNDRGPFAENRIIDLSYVAAKKLGMLGKGTAYVDVKAIDPNHMPSNVPLVARKKTKSNIFAVNKRTNSAVYLQVGAFKNKLHAENLKKRLRSVVSSPIMITDLAHKSNKLYRVKIGPIQDVATADNITQRLREMGLTAKSY